MNNHQITLELVECPDCHAPAEVVDRFVLAGTSGPVELVTVQCLARHWFTVVADTLVPAVTGPAAAEETAR